GRWDLSQLKRSIRCFAVEGGKALSDPPVAFGDTQLASAFAGPQLKNLAYPHSCSSEKNTKNQRLACPRADLRPGVPGTLPMPAVEPRFLAVDSAPGQPDRRRQQTRSLGKTGVPGP